MLGIGKWSKIFICTLAIAFLSTSTSFAWVNQPPLKIQEEDGSPSRRPRTLKVTNGTLTTNSDGSLSLSTGGGGGGTECVSSACDLHVDTELNNQGICLADGTDCPAGGAGDLLADGTVPMTADWEFGNFDLTLKSLIGDGSITMPLIVGGIATGDDLTLRGTSHGDNNGYIILNDLGGRVGIGTVSPGEALEVRVVAPLIRLRATGSTANNTAAYVEFGGTTATNFNRTGYVGDSVSGDTHIRLVAEDSDLILWAEKGDLILGDSSSATVLTLSGGDVIIAGNIKGLPQPLRFNLPMPKDFYDNVDHEVLIWRQVDADITITLIECSLDASGNELNFDLMYADAFIGFGGATRIDTLDTTSGVFSETSSFENATVAAGKDIYFLLDATPHEDITQVVCYIKYDYD